MGDRAPLAGPADAARVGQFLNRVAALNPTRSLADAGPPEEYGLAEPALEVSLALADGSTPPVPPTPTPAPTATPAG